MGGSQFASKFLFGPFVIIYSIPIPEHLLHVYSLCCKQNQCCKVHGLVSFIPGEGTLDLYLVLLTNILIYKMCQILDDRSTWVTVVISLQAFSTPRKQNLFTIFSLEEMSRSHASCLVMRLVLVFMHFCTHWWVFWRQWPILPFSFLSRTISNSFLN